MSAGVDHPVIFPADAFGFPRLILRSCLASVASCAWIEMRAALVIVAAVLAACSGTSRRWPAYGARHPDEGILVQLSAGAQAAVRVEDARFTVHPTGGACALLDLKNFSLASRTLRCTYTWLDRAGVPVGSRDGGGQRVQLAAGERRLVQHYAAKGSTVTGYRVYIDTR